MTRPRIFVLAGVNGAGKSSVGGHALQRVGIAWFNPDTFARALVEATGSPQADANVAAWHEGVRRLDQAIAQGHDHAFETTLGGNTIVAKLREASASHDLQMWYCGLDSPEHHIARVRLRVSRGGHDIPEAKIRERWHSSLANLIGLMPRLSQLQLYDNSRDAAPGTSVPDPKLLLQTAHGRILWPTDTEALQQTPDWAKPILEAALQSRE
ncbi:hypothetical protein MASR1M8_03220 [Thermomonas brevis]